MARSYGAGLATGLALGLVAALFAPALRPVASRWGRPLAKGAIKGGLDTYESARERVAVLSEHLEDLIAEAQVERMTESLRRGRPVDTSAVSEARRAA